MKSRCMAAPKGMPVQVLRTARAVTHCSAILSSSAAEIPAGAQERHTLTLTPRCRARGRGEPQPGSSRFPVETFDTGLVPLGGVTRADRSARPADEPDRACMDRRARSAPDDPDAAGKDQGKAVGGDGPRDSSPGPLDSALRTERAAAYRAAVDAAYRQHAIDRSDAPDRSRRPGTYGRPRVTPHRTGTSRPRPRTGTSRSPTGRPRQRDRPRDTTSGCGTTCRQALAGPPRT